MARPSSLQLLTNNADDGFVDRDIIFPVGDDRRSFMLIFVYVTCAIDATLAELDHRHMRLDYLRKDGVSTVAESREYDSCFPCVVMP